MNETGNGTGGNAPSAGSSVRPVDYAILAQAFAVAAVIAVLVIHVRAARASAPHDPRVGVAVLWGIGSVLFLVSVGLHQLWIVTRRAATHPNILGETWSLTVVFVTLYLSTGVSPTIPALVFWFSEACTMSDLVSGRRWGLIGGGLAGLACGLFIAVGHTSLPAGLVWPVLLCAVSVLSVILGAMDFHQPPRLVIKGLGLAGNIVFFLYSAALTAYGLRWLLLVMSRP